MTKSAFAIGTAFLLSACSLGLTGKAPPFLLTLTPSASPAANAGTNVAAVDTITITVPIAPQAITNNRVPVSSDGTAIAYIKDAVWIEPPARLFQRLLSETVRARTGRIVLDPRQFTEQPGAQLSGQLLHFEIDEPTRQAIVVYEATLSGGKSVRTRRFEARAPLSVIDARSSGTALNRAANQVAGEVSAWIGAGN
jgi:cholesterol transport system auxiliary component